jgi:hypothetical protein
MPQSYLLSFSFSPSSFSSASSFLTLPYTSRLPFSVSSLLFTLSLPSEHFVSLTLNVLALADVHSVPINTNAGKSCILIRYYTWTRGSIAA